MPTTGEMIANLRQVLVTQHQEAMAELQTAMAELQQLQAELPMRVHNAAASLNAPLHFPACANVAPLTKLQLLRLNAADSQALAEALGLPAAGATVVECHQQIMNFLGCGINI